MNALILMAMLAAPPECPTIRISAGGEELLIRQLDPDLKVSVQAKEPEPWPNSTVIRWNDCFIEFRGKPMQHEEKLPDMLMYLRGLRSELKEQLEEAEEENAYQVEDHIERLKIHNPTVSRSDLEMTRRVMSDTRPIRRLKDELTGARAREHALSFGCTRLSKMNNTEADRTDNGWTVKNYGRVVAKVLIPPPSS